MNWLSIARWLFLSISLVMVTLLVTRQWVIVSSPTVAETGRGSSQKRSGADRWREILRDDLREFDRRRQKSRVFIGPDPGRDSPLRRWHVVLTDKGPRLSLSPAGETQDFRALEAAARFELKHENGEDIRISTGKHWRVLRPGGAIRSRDVVLAYPDRWLRIRIGNDGLFHFYSRPASEGDEESVAAPVIVPRMTLLHRGLLPQTLRDVEGVARFHAAIRDGKLIYRNGFLVPAKRPDQEELPSHVGRIGLRRLLRLYNDSKDPFGVRVRLRTKGMDQHSYFDETLLKGWWQRFDKERSWRPLAISRQGRYGILLHPVRPVAPEYQKRPFAVEIRWDGDPTGLPADSRVIVRPLNPRDSIEGTGTDGGWSIPSRLGKGFRLRHPPPSAKADECLAVRVTSPAGTPVETSWLVALRLHPDTGWAAARPCDDGRIGNPVAGKRLVLLRSRLRGGGNVSLHLSGQGKVDVWLDGKRQAMDRALPAALTLALGSASSSHELWIYRHDDAVPGRLRLTPPGIRLDAHGRIREFGPELVEYRRASVKRKRRQGATYGVEAGTVRPRLLVEDGAGYLPEGSAIVPPSDKRGQWLLLVPGKRSMAGRLFSIRYRKGSRKKKEQRLYWDLTKSGRVAFHHDVSPPLPVYYHPASWLRFSPLLPVDARGRNNLPRPGVAVPFETDRSLLVLDRKLHTGLEVVTAPQLDYDGRVIVSSPARNAPWMLRSSASHAFEPGQTALLYGLNLRTTPTGMLLAVPEKSLIKVTVDGIALAPGHERRLDKDAVLEVGGLRLRYSGAISGFAGARWLDEDFGVQLVRQQVESLGKGRIALRWTLEPELQRMVLDEVLRTLAVVESQYRQDLARLLQIESRVDGAHPWLQIAIRRLKRRLEELEPAAGVVILDDQSRIVAAVSAGENAPQEQLAWGKGVMPGSSIKPLTALGALAAGGWKIRRMVLKGESPVVGRDTLKGVPFGGGGHRIEFDLHNFHGKKQRKHNLTQAIAHSDNIYFAYLGLLGDTHLARGTRPKGLGPGQFWYRALADLHRRSMKEWPMLGIAELLGANRRIDLIEGLEVGDAVLRAPGGSMLLARPAELPARLVRENEIARASIGEGDVRVTPLFGALLIQAAARGKVAAPRLLDGIVDEKGEWVAKVTGKESVDLPGMQRRGLLSGLRQVVSAPGGTAYRAFSTRFGKRLRRAETDKSGSGMMDLIGKTGTAWSGLRAGWRSVRRAKKLDRAIRRLVGRDGMEYDHSWFLCRFRKNDREAWNIAVVVPYSGLGGRVAADLASRIIGRLDRMQQKISP